MRLVLSAAEPELAAAWVDSCGDLDFVRVESGSILETTVALDAVVSPANSFGFMDGGIDALYCEYFGWDLQDRVRRQILDVHHGELVVGQADVVETGRSEIPFLFVAPTMRVPMALFDTVNPYLAARAVFVSWRHGRFAGGRHDGIPVREVIDTVAMPGLGTGVGRVGARTCARQVRQAIDDILLDAFEVPTSSAEASERHQRLYTDRPKPLQQPELW